MQSTSRETIGTGPSGAPTVTVAAAGIAAVEVTQAQVEDFLLDVLGLAGMNGFAQLLNQELEELGRARWRVLRNASGVTGSELLAKLRGQLLDRRPWAAPTELEHGVVAVLGRVDLVRLEPRHGALDHDLAPDAVIIGVRAGLVEQVAGRAGTGAS